MAEPRKGYGKAGKPALVKRSKKEVDEFLAQLNSEVADLPDEQLKALQPILQQAAEELEAKLAEWLSRQDDPEARFTAIKYRQMMLQTRTAFAKAERELAKRMGVALDEGAVSADALARQQLADTVAFYLPDFDKGLVAMPLQQATSILTDESLIEKHARSAKRYGAETTQRIKKDLALGMVQGESITQIGKRVAKTTGRTLSQSEMIVRTEMVASFNNAADRSQKALAEENPEIEMLQKWNGILDGRICERCRVLHGETWFPDEPPPYGLPPLHPHCRCVVTLEIEPPQ